MWSAGFISILGAPVLQMAFIVRVVQIGDVPGDGGYTAASMSYLGDPVIAPRGVSISGSRLTPGTWATTLGGASIQLVGDLRRLLRAMTRGTFVEVLAGQTGAPSSDFEVIFTGQVQQISTSGRTAGVLEVRDLVSAMRCRPTSTPAQADLYYNDDASTTIATTAYTVGDGTLKVASTADFERPDGLSGGLRVDNGSDEPFVLRWSAKTGTEFTLSGAGDEQHGTLRVNAAIGADVTPLFFLEAHPIDAVRHILVSTGAGANGAYDILPVSWGFLLPDRWIDHEDADDYRALSEPSMVWEFMLDQQSTDPLGWLSGCLARGGFYLTTRMGLLTCRAALMSTIEASGVSSAVATAGRDQMALSDGEIESIAWQAWDSEMETEYVNLTVYSSQLSAGVWSTSNSSAGTEQPATLPTSYRQEYDLSDLLYTGATAGRESIVGRLWESAQRVPERYTVVLAGLRGAVLAPGDFVRVTSARIAGRLERTIDGLNDCRMIVLQVSVDWGRGRVTLSGAVYPTDDQAFS